MHQYTAAQVLSVGILRKNRRLMSAGAQTYVKRGNGDLHRYSSTLVLSVGILRKNRRLMSAGVQTYVKRGNGNLYPISLDSFERENFEGKMSADERRRTNVRQARKRRFLPKFTAQKRKKRVVKQVTTLNFNRDEIT